MRLFEILTRDRMEILERCRLSIIKTNGLPPSHELDRGLTIMFNQLVEIFENSGDDDSSETRHMFVNQTIADSNSRRHAQESHSEGHTISQLVRGYCSICQAITEFALESGESISSAEFAQLNLSLDVAIAQAVTEFQRLSVGTAAKSEKLKMGFLVHELRTCLSSAVLSHELVRLGRVGTSGATSRIITNAHNQMRELIDHSVAEVRMNSNPELDYSVFSLLDLLSEVEISLAPESNLKKQMIYTTADPTLEIEADRHLMVSALTNLVQNAIKYSKDGGAIWLRAHLDGTDAVIEVEDRCGGLPEGTEECLFQPFFRGKSESSGIGLGLSIARRAAELNGCSITVRNLPGNGCVFSMRMPAYEGAFQSNLKKTIM